MPVQPTLPTAPGSHTPTPLHAAYSRGVSTLKGVMGSSVGDAVSKDQGLEGLAAEASVGFKDK